MYLLFDIGGTNIRLAVSEDSESIINKQIFDTPADYDSAIDLVVQRASELTNGQDLEAVSGGVAAVFDKEHEKIIRAPHLHEWENRNIKRDLENRLNAKVYVRNDTDMAGLGEAVSGSGSEFGIVAYLTISTGIGGSRIVNKQIDKYTVGFEPGHQIIDADGSICPECEAFEGTSGLGHWEAVASGAAIKRRYGQDPREIVDTKIWDEIADLISVGLTNTIVHWSPEVVVLGGGLMESSFLDIGLLKEKLQVRLNIFPEVPVLKKAKLGKFNAIFGALHYLKQNI